MIPLFLYFAAAFGFAFAVGHSEITYGFRLSLSKFEDHTLAWWFLKLLECPPCLGFWIGLISAASGLVVPPSFSFLPGVFVLAFATVGVNLLLGRWTGLVE